MDCANWECGSWKLDYLLKGKETFLLKTLLKHWNYYLNWVFYELNGKVIKLE